MTLDRDTALLILLGFMALMGICVLVGLAFMLRKSNREKRESEAKAAELQRDMAELVEADQTIARLRSQIAGERRSPVPDLTLIRAYERQIEELETKQRKAVETPWGPAK